MQIDWNAAFCERSAPHCAANDRPCGDTRLNGVAWTGMLCLTFEPRCPRGRMPRTPVARPVHTGFAKRLDIANSGTPHRRLFDTHRCDPSTPPTRNTRRLSGHRDRPLSRTLLAFGTRGRAVARAGDSMKIHVLGSGAGGGFPQWNCNCDNCRRLRSGQLNGTARTQSSIAVSNGSEDWILFGASPDLRTQIESFPALQPARRVRDTAIRAIFLVDSQVDQTTGLMTLRECDQRLTVYCTKLVYEDLTSSYPLLTVLEHYCGVDWHEVSVEPTWFEIDGAQGLRFRAIPIESNAPPFSPRRDAPQPGDNVYVRIEDERTGGSLVYVPGLGSWDEDLYNEMESASCLLVDGTAWRNDDLQRAGARDITAQDMGHLHQAGEDGLLDRLAGMRGPRKILTHINNTNPLLDEDSPEHAQLTDAGVELAYDGMDIEL